METINHTFGTQQSGDNRFRMREGVGRLMDAASSQQQLLMDSIGPVIVFALLYCAFFSPVIFSNRLLAPGDGYVYYLPLYLAGRTAWTSLMFSGFPLVGDPQAMFCYPPAMVLSPLNNSWNAFVILAYVLASCFTFWFVRQITQSRVGGLVAGIIYGMSGFFMVHLGHTSIIHSAVWLPLILWGLENLKKGKSIVWFLVSSGGIGLSLLGGHPQISIYSLFVGFLYIVMTGGEAGKGRWPYYRISLFVFLCGIAMAAIQLLPMIELARYSVRSNVSADVFNSFSLPPKQLITLFFPYLLGAVPSPLYKVRYFGAWNLTELTGYVGLLPLMLSSISLVGIRKNLQARFWGLIAIVSILLVVGPSTPLARVLYHLPGVNSFRVPARHFLEFSFSVSVLAGCGIAILGKQKPSVRVVWAVRLVISFLIAFGLALLAVVIEYGKIGSLAIRQGVNNWVAVPWHNPGIIVPILTCSLVAAVLLVWCKYPQWYCSALLLCSLIVDLGSFGWLCEWHYHSPQKSQLQMSGVLEKYQRALNDRHQRMLSYRGGQGSAEEGMPNLNLVWHLPNVSGYDPLILSRYNRLSTVQAWGGIDAEVLNSRDQTLDVLATRYVFFPKGALDGRVTVSRFGVGWSAGDLTIRLGVGCGDGKASELDYNIPYVTATEIGVVSNLGTSTQVPEGSGLVEIGLEDESGSFQYITLRAGEDTSEWAWDRADVQKIVQHKRAKVFDSVLRTDLPGGKFEGHGYYSIRRFDRYKTIKGIRLRWIGPCGVTLGLAKLSLIDEVKNKSFAVNSLLSALGGDNRWRLAGDYERTMVYENTRAMPRVWPVSRVLSLQPDQIVKAVKTSQLPDGSRFDCGDMALIEEPLSWQNGQGDKEAKISVTKIMENSLEFAVDSYSGAFLVLSDIDFPGWVATVDEKRVRVFTTDYVLRGIGVPAGSHKVRFVFQPVSFYIGVAISATCLVILFGLISVLWLKKGSKRAGNGW